MSDRGVAVVVQDGLLLHQISGDTVLPLPIPPLDTVPSALLATPDGFWLAWTTSDRAIATANVVCDEP